MKRIETAPLKETETILADLDARMKKMKPITQDEYLRRAEINFAILSQHEKRFLKDFGEPLPPNGPTSRFVGKAVWHNLMGWAGFPMWFDEGELR